MDIVPQFPRYCPEKGLPEPLYCSRQKYYRMGRFAAGDVLLASVALDDRMVQKPRPVVVVRVEEAGCVLVCPVGSKPPSDAPSIPLSIDDFSLGGLDLFRESYVMTSRVFPIRNCSVIRRKGRLTADALAEIASRIPESLPDGTGVQGRSHR